MCRDTLSKSSVFFAIVKDENDVCGRIFSNKKDNDTRNSNESENTIRQTQVMLVKVKISVWVTSMYIRKLMKIMELTVNIYSSYLQKGETETVCETV